MAQHLEVAEQKTTRRRKVQAVLAGGTVLGIGALVTLAAWNDSEFAQGTFGASTFNLEGSLDGEAFEEHEAVDEAATLDFTAENMTPGETVYAPFSVRLDEDTTIGGSIAEGGISVADSDGENTDALSYEIFADPESCNADGTNGDPVGSGTTLATGSSANSSLTLSAGDNDSAGAPIEFCFVVSAADDDSFTQGGEASATWEVMATSDEN